MLLHRYKKMSKSPRKASSCESCGAQFSSISILKNHVDSECSTKKRFRCNFCEALFMTKYSLKTHEKTKHIESGVKKFKCGFCEKVFASKGQVKVHERMHTKEKAFKCGICEKAFSHRESLVTHSTLHTGMKVKRIYFDFVPISLKPLKRKLTFAALRLSMLPCTILLHRKLDQAS